MMVTNYKASYVYHVVLCYSIPPSVYDVIKYFS